VKTEVPHWTPQRRSIGAPTKERNWLMSGPVVIQKRFVPKVGEARNLRLALSRMSDALVAEGYPEMELMAPMHGGHGVFVTVERYPSLAAWEEYNRTAPTRPGLVSAVFDGIYPTTLAPYDTEILSVVEKEPAR
jgi:hypothetical protein